MNRSFIILHLLIFTLCNGQDKMFKVVKDTTFINIKGQLSSSLLYNDKYYSFFEEENPISTKPTKKFYVLSRKGNIEREINVPAEIEREFYYNIHLRNDSIIVTTDFYKSTLLLDIKKYEWIKIKSKEKFIYEDSNYFVSTTDSGEWGSTLYFEDKRTKRLYECMSINPIVVNLIDNKYFITCYLKHMFGQTWIIEIDDPLKMSFVTSRREPYHESKSSIGQEVIFDSVNYYIPTSFVYNNELFHLYKANKRVFVGQLQNNKMINISDLKDDLSLSLQQFSDKRQFLIFHTMKNNVYGYMEIIENKILIHYLIKKGKRI